jgi:hypothetical protein
MLRSASRLLRLAPLLVPLALLVAPSAVRVQAADCQPTWMPTFGAPDDLSAHVRALAVFDGGGGPALYAGGAFTTAGGLAANRVARWDGSSWSTLGTGMNDRVYGLAALDDGSGMRLYAGGLFTTAGGVAANHVARWDGASWRKLGSGTSDSVWDFAMYDDGNGGGPALYAGGDFTQAGGVNARYIARWDGGSWSPLGTGMSDYVDCLAVFDDGSGSGPCLIAGGVFLGAGSVSNVKCIARWDGTSWASMANGMFIDSKTLPHVLSLAIFDDGSGPALYAGGRFDFAGGVPASNIARWDGTIWSALGSGIVGNVETLEVLDDGRGPALYAGGFITSAGGVPANGIARWDGTSWTALGSGLHHWVYALAELDHGSGPVIHAGGEFTSPPDSDDFIAAWGGCPPSPWTDLGFALPGVAGAPHLAGTGDLAVGSAGALALSDAAPTAQAVLFLSSGSTPAPFKCGTLVPVPVLSSLVLATDPVGELTLAWSSWPAGLSGLSLHFQCAIQDAAAVCGVSLSNALRADVP